MVFAYDEHTKHKIKEIWDYRFQKSLIVFKSPMVNNQWGARPIHSLSRGDWKFIYFLPRFLIGYFLSKWKVRFERIHWAKHLNWSSVNDQWGVRLFYFKKKFVWSRPGPWQIVTDNLSVTINKLIHQSDSWIWFWFGSQIF